MKKNKQTPFRLDENYFEKLPYQIQDKIYEQQKTTFWNSTSFKWSALSLGLSALIIGFLIIPRSTASFEKQFKQLSSQEIATYLQVFDDVEEQENEIIELVLTKEYTPQAADFMAFSSDEINDYLNINDTEQDEYYEYEEFMD